MAVTLFLTSGYPIMQPSQSSQHGLRETSTADGETVNVRNTQSIEPSSLQTSDGSSNEAGDSQELAASGVTALVGYEELANERVGQFMKLLPQVLNSENPEAVHDLRVCGRRLQQVLVAMFPGEQGSRATKEIR